MRRERGETRGGGGATENGREEREREGAEGRTGRKIGRSTILLVRRRGSKQNAWSTSELFPFPSSSPFSTNLPFPSFSPSPSLRHPLLPLSSLTQGPPSQLGRHKLLPVAGAFFPIPSLARSLCAPSRASLQNVRRVTRNYENSEARPFASLNYRQRG